MLTVTLVMILLGLVVYGLERNHARRARAFDGHLAGSTDATDRDTERVLAELRAR